MPSKAVCRRGLMRTIRPTLATEPFHRLESFIDRKLARRLEKGEQCGLKPGDNVDCVALLRRPCLAE